MTPIRRIPDDDNSTFTERPGRTSGGQSSQLSRISPRAHATHGDRVCTVPSDEGGEKDASIHVVARGGGCRRGRVFGGSGAGADGGGDVLERPSDNDHPRRELPGPSPSPPSTPRPKSRPLPHRPFPPARRRAPPHSHT